MDKIVFNSLKKKMAFMLTISVTISLMVFCLLFNGTNYLLYDIFENTDFRHTASKKLATGFQTYVNQYNLASSDADLIRQWADVNGILYFTISRDRMLIYDNTYSGTIPFDQTLSNQLNNTWMYFSKVSFADGDADVFIYKNNEKKYFIIAELLSAIVAILSGFLFFLIQIKSEIKYIVSLSNEVTKMRNDINSAHFIQRGNDEIANLANALETMRLQLIEKKQNEILMKEAQDVLVLSIAHDLRTPLTSLIAYIEIIKRQDSISEISKFSNKVLQQANHIKNLSDQLFDLFLINSGQREDIERLSNTEYAFSDYFSELYNYLESQNYQLDVSHLTWHTANISICFDYIGRIINNIQSNIVKYADKTFPVIISSELTEKNFSIIIENTINRQANKNSSTGIGVKNINSMMQKMDGTCFIETICDNYIMTLKFNQYSKICKKVES